MQVGGQGLHSVPCPAGVLRGEAAWIHIPLPAATCCPKAHGPGRGPRWPLSSLRLAVGLSAGARSPGTRALGPVLPALGLPHPLTSGTGGGGCQEEVLACSWGKQALQVPGGLPGGTDSCHALQILQMLSAP